MTVRITGMGCCLAALLAAAVPVRADQPVSPSQQGAMLCTDGMVTDPDSDDPEAIEISDQGDDGCQMPDGPVGT